MTADLTQARGLVEYIDASPSPFHACAETARRLDAAGFTRLDESDSWAADAIGRHYILRAGSLIAWAVESDLAPTTGFRIVAAHSDSPNLRIKPRPNTSKAGCRQLGVEIYGGALLNSWLDRDLGLSGRVMVRGERGPEERLLKIDRPMLRVPQLAIHLDGDIRSKGLQLDKQAHMSPVWGMGSTEEFGFEAFLATELGCEADDVLGWDVMCHDTNPSTISGRDEEFVSAARLDNLCSSFTALQALTETLKGEVRHIPVVCLFDHEEVGSGSSRGAVSPILKHVLERLVLGRGGSREDFHRAVAASICCSADMAHATHPNYVARHEPNHHLQMNAGPVIKLNTNMRYATDAEGEAHFQTCCEEADVPFQKWVIRTDLACGSTIGPVTAANLGMHTVDVGSPQLAMHSAREMCGSHDPGFMVRAMTAFMS